MRFTSALLGLALLSCQSSSVEQAPYNPDTTYTQLLLSTPVIDDIQKIGIPDKYLSAASIAAVHGKDTFRVVIRDQKAEFTPYGAVSYDGAQRLSEMLDSIPADTIEQFALGNVIYEQNCDCSEKKVAQGILQNFQDRGFNAVATLRYDSVPGMYVSPKRAPKKLW